MKALADVSSSKVGYWVNLRYEYATGLVSDNRKMRTPPRFGLGGGGFYSMPTTPLPMQPHEKRREFYMIVAIVISALGFSHALGYWPSGAQDSIPAGDEQVVTHTQPWWWSFGYWASMLSLGALYVVGRIAGRNSQPKVKASEPSAPLSSTEANMQMNAASAFRLLTWAQKIALRRIYRQPGMMITDVIQGLTNLGFCEAEKNIVSPIMKTNLVAESPAGCVTVSAHAIISKTVQEELAQTEL
jgi:hypothetical protein